MAIEFQSSFHIAAPPEEVQSAMTRFDQWPQWMKGLNEVEPLTEGPYSAGTRWRETRTLMGKRATEEFEVIDCEPGRIELFVDGSRGSTGKGEYRFVYRLTPEGEGTRLVMDAAIDIPGAFAKVVGTLMKGMFKKSVDADTKALKAWLEDGRATTPTSHPERDAPPAH